MSAQIGLFSVTVQAVFTEVIGKCDLSTIGVHCHRALSLPVMPRGHMVRVARAGPAPDLWSCPQALGYFCPTELKAGPFLRLLCDWSAAVAVETCLFSFLSNKRLIE